jgi:hypothetical protein
MPNEADILQYRHFRTTNLSFVSATAPTSTDPNYIAGLNMMSSYKGYVERRPGFDVGLEPTPTTFADSVQRTFSWRRWSSTFYIMLCTVGTVAKVYKLAIGTDTSFSLIWTSTSAEPFDFVTSNNFCFFGNGTDMRKFDGTTVTKWGISPPNASIVGPTIAGNGTNGATGTVSWTNPNNVTSAVSFATAALTSGQTTKNLQAKGFGFAIPTTATISGIVVTYDFKATTSSGTNIITGGGGLLKAGITVGAQKALGSFPSTVTTVMLGSSTDLWGSTWTAADINDANFGPYFFASQGVGSNTASIKNVNVTIFYTDLSAGAPTTSTSGTGITANTGWTYVYCYQNSVTGHVSSPGAPSISTGAVANKTVNVTVVASTDPQVDTIRIFRTTDGGGGVWFEIANSPVANVSAAYPDVTTDANLSLVTAPTFGFNDPPSNAMGAVWFANRIWTFNNATLYFTDWEELSIGVPEESSVSGPAGNFWNFDSEITGLSVAQDGVIVFTAGSIFKIDGDSLDTFRRTTIAKGLGCRNRATIARLGGLTAFLANTNSIWTTDSSSLTEISSAIQPTIDNIDHSQASMAFHFQGQYRWLLLCDAGHDQTVPFDVNTEQWMPPWSIVPTAISSGETSAGNWTLLVGQKTSKKMLQMIPGQYTDNSVTYAMSGTTSPMPLVNEHMSAANPTIDLYYPQAPEHVAEMEYVAFETNAIQATTIKRMFDDDPATATFVDITAKGVNSPLKTVVQGVNIIDFWYYDRAWSGKRVSIQFNYAAANNNPKIYTMTIAYKQVR